MPHICASLLAADFACLGAEVQRAEAAGVDSFHFDFMDGHYAPNLALCPQHLIALRRFTNLRFLVHLQLTNPDQVIEEFAPLDADLITVMWDTIPNPRRTFANIRAQGKQVGISLNPDEPVALAREVLSELDILIIMGVQPGFGGQVIDPHTVEKVREARTTITAVGLDLPIVVDGGVNRANARNLISSGADTLIIGTALFQAGNMRAFVSEIMEPVEA